MTSAKAPKEHSSCHYKSEQYSPPEKPTLREERKG